MPFYGHDLGGFFGDFPVEELLVRSSQSAVFQPRFVIHSWREDGRVTEPWSYPDSLDLIRGHIREHYRFMPYTYNCALEAARTGVPVERPLFLEFPGDPQIDDRDFNTLYGSSILKILVVDEGARSAIVHFPSPASWYDPAEHCLRPGGSTMEIQVPMEGARWFAMAGSVIPTSPGLESLKTGYFGLIEFLVFPPASGGEVAFVYYEDDGKTELEPGRFNAWTVSASYDAEAGQGRIHILATQCSDVDPSADRLMRVALPPSFRFKEGTLPQATVGDLRESRGGEWEFEGGYIMSGKKEER
jgi:alpha-glucosidase